MIKKLNLLILLGTLAASTTANSQITEGTISNWAESGPVLEIGDGTNSVNIWWSFDGIGKGYFYGSLFTGTSDVADARTITDYTQVTDASIFTFLNTNTTTLCDADCDPDGVGDFVIYRNNSSGHFAILRIDDIVNTDTLNATWWFQSNGSGDFSGSVDPVDQLMDDVVGVGPGNSLHDKMVLVQAYLDANDIESACGALNGFVNSVRAQSGKKIDAMVADDLIAQAESIMSSLGCS